MEHNTLYRIKDGDSSPFDCELLSRKIQAQSEREAQLSFVMNCAPIVAVCTPDSCLDTHGHQRSLFSASVAPPDVSPSCIDLSLSPLSPSGSFSFELSETWGSNDDIVQKTAGVPLVDITKSTRVSNNCMAIGVVGGRYIDMNAIL